MAGKANVEEATGMLSIFLEINNDQVTSQQPNLPTAIILDQIIGLEAN